MAYFANGTEGLDYQERYCMRCRNWGIDKLSENSGEEGCPIWDLHLLYSYEECNSTSNAKMMLDTLIPMIDYTAKDGVNYHMPGECSMFVARPGLEVPGQLSLEE
jgi:hypothetical protein